MLGLLVVVKVRKLLVLVKVCRTSCLGQGTLLGLLVVGKVLKLPVLVKVCRTSCLELTYVQETGSTKGFRSESPTVRSFGGSCSAY